MKNQNASAAHSSDQLPAAPGQERSATPTLRIACLLLIGLLQAAGHTVGARAETWAEKLGYPEGSRVVILHASEVGTCYATNQAAQQGLADGNIQAVSVMPPTAWSSEFLAWYREHPQYDVGVSITMNSDNEAVKWGPVSAGSDVRSLVDKNGYLWRHVHQTAINASRDDVAREVEAQILRARLAGIQPGHLGLHLGTMIARSDLAEVYLEAARRHWIPAIIVELTPGHITRFQRMGFPLDERMIQIISSYPLPKLDELKFCPPGETYEQKLEELLELLRDLEPGITQINFAPAVESDAIKRMDPLWKQRVWEARLLADPALGAVISEEQILTTDWKQIMRRFDGLDEDEPGSEEPTQP